MIFYKGFRGNWLDWLICFFTMGEFSHVEIVYNDECYSASKRDNGVRKKSIKIDDKWHLKNMPQPKPENIEKFVQHFENTKDRSYDFLSLLFSYIIPIKIQDRNKYYCSEWVAESLNILYDKKIETNISPNYLYDTLFMNGYGNYK